MKQLARRLLYTAGGIAPAAFALPLAVAFGGLILAGAGLGIAGLIAATWLRFPVSRQAYGRIALLLVGGLAAMLPFSAIILFATFADLFSGSTGLPIGTAMRDAATRSWAFAGPVLCAFHFLWLGRKAPNNSFKGMPLRGTP